MKAKEYLKEFMLKHGLSVGEIWQQHELIKLMETYEYQSLQKENESLKEENKRVLELNKTHLQMLSQSEYVKVMDVNTKLSQENKSLKEKLQVERELVKLNQGKFKKIKEENEQLKLPNAENENYYRNLSIKRGEQIDLLREELKDKEERIKELEEFANMVAQSYKVVNKDEDYKNILISLQMATMKLFNKKTKD